MIVGIDRDAGVEQRLQWLTVTQRMLTHAVADLEDAAHRLRRQPTVTKEGCAIGAIETELFLGHHGTFPRRNYLRRPMHSRQAGELLLRGTSLQKPSGFRDVR